MFICSNVTVPSEASSRCFVKEFLRISGILLLGIYVREWYSRKIFSEGSLSKLEFNFYLSLNRHLLKILFLLGRNF